MKRNFVPLAVSFVVGSALGGLIGGGFMHTMLSYFLCLFVVVPSLIILIVIGFERWLRKDRSDVKSRLALNCMILVVSMLAFAGVGAAVLHYRKTEVRKFVEQVLPLLDTHKKKTGKYPQRLGEVTKQKTPNYWRESGRYLSDGCTFTFYYESPELMMGGLMLTDSHRSWSRAD